MNDELLLKMLLDDLSCNFFQKTNLEKIIEEYGFKEEYIKALTCLKLTYNKNNVILIKNILSEINLPIKPKTEYNKYMNFLTYENKCKFLNILKILDFEDTSYQIKLIKKSFKNIYQFVSNNDEIDINDILPICHNASECQENYVELEMLYDISLIIYLSKLLKKQCYFNNRIEEFLLIRTREVLHINNISYNKINNILKQSKDKLKLLKNLYLIENVNLNTIEQYLTTIKLRAYQSEVPDVLNDLFRSDITSSIHEKKIYREKSSKVKEVISSFEDFLAYHNLSLKELSYNVSYNLQDFNEIWYFVTQGPIILENENDTNWVFQCNIYFIALHYIKLLLKNISYFEKKYINMKNESQKIEEELKSYKQNNNKNNYIEIDEYTNLLQKHDNLINEHNVLKNSYSTIQNKYSDLQQEYNNLQRDYNKLLKELEDNHNYRKEVIALREYIYKHEDEEEINTSNIQIQDMISFFLSKKCLILGGRPTWINKLKEVFPHFDYMEKEDINRKFKDLDKIDYLFLNTSYFNHPFYYKLMNEVNKYSIKLVYLKGYSNIERTIQEMYSQK